MEKREASRKDARKQSPEKWFETFLLSHGGVERHTVIVEPRVPRGISSGSLALDGVGLYPSRQKKPCPRGIPLEAGPVGTVGKMPMPRQVTTESFSSLSLRLCAFALFCFSLLPSPALVGYPPANAARQNEGGSC